MAANCPLCGRHLTVEETRDRKNTAITPNGTEIVICSDCGRRKRELERTLKRYGATSPRQINLFKTSDNAELIELIKREQKLKESTEPPKTDEHGCLIGVEVWDPDLHQCVKIKEPEAPMPEKDAHGCLVGVEEWNDDLHQCIKIGKHPPTKEQVVVPYQPAPAIPVQPVVPVGPITVEQKVAALNDEIAKIQKQIAFIFGLLGQKMENVGR